MRSATILGLGLALAGLVGFGSAVAAGEGKACDVKQVEKGYYCDTCKALLETSAVDVKEMKHKGMDHAVQEAQVCVKTLVDCQAEGCDMSWAKGAPVPGCCKEHATKENVTKSRVVWKCDACGAAAGKQTDVRHTGEGCTGKIVKSCEKSGTPPHVAT
jgi:hypothetical protein